MNFLTKGQRKAIDDLCEQGYISAARNDYHKKLVIFNYTKKTQYEGFWNEYTKMCRGLVVDDNNRIVIKSPEKFFNESEPEAPNMAFWDTDDIIITEKLDGYYISFRLDSEHGFILTSRGSFNNKYVDAAFNLIPENWDIQPDTDYFCELCQTFPGDESLIVAKYDKPSLILWGVNDGVPSFPDTTGCDFDRNSCPLEIAKAHSLLSTGEYLNKKVEGVVAYNKKTKQRVKIKTKWYLETHRLISNVSFKNAFEGVVSRTLLSENINLPEEHKKMVLDWEETIKYWYQIYYTKAVTEFETWREKSDKELALSSLVAKELKPIVFAMRKNKDYKPLIWRLVKNTLLRDTADK